MRKIMFNDKYFLTKEVLEGKKIQTRRLIPKEFFSLTWDVRENTLVYENDFGEFIDIRESKYSLYKKDEVVALAQNYEDAGYKCYPYRDTDEFMFIMVNGKDYSIPPVAVNNKMFVKPELMPHQIQITDIRIERLQDISDDDCLKEGILKEKSFYGEDVYNIRVKGKTSYYSYDTPIEAYAALIDKVSGKGTWDSNPFVFVYEFKLIK